MTLKKSPLCINTCRTKVLGTGNTVFSLRSNMSPDFGKVFEMFYSLMRQYIAAGGEKKLL